MCVLLNFQLDRARIAKVLCVQRAVPEETRTCHGECHLRDQLKPLQADDPQQAPVETNMLSLIPVFLPENGDRRSVLPIRETGFGIFQVIVAEGYTGKIEQVPRG